MAPLYVACLHHSLVASGESDPQWKLRAPSTSIPMNKVDCMASYDPESEVRQHPSCHTLSIDTHPISQAHPIRQKIRPHLLLEERQGCIVEGHVGWEIVSWTSLVNMICHGYYFCSEKYELVCICSQTPLLLLRYSTELDL